MIYTLKLTDGKVGKRFVKYLEQSIYDSVGEEITIMVDNGDGTEKEHTGILEEILNIED